MFDSLTTGEAYGLKEVFSLFSFNYSLLWFNLFFIILNSFLIIKSTSIVKHGRSLIKIDYKELMYFVSSGNMSQRLWQPLTRGN